VEGLVAASSNNAVNATVLASRRVQTAARASPAGARVTRYVGPDDTENQ
jgi:hypothetical protein